MNKEKSESYLSEVFSSIQGEGGSLKGSCFGKRQIFIRFSGCNLFNSLNDISSCFWCDSSEAQQFKNPKVKFEEIPGTKRFKYLRNPLKNEQVITIIQNLVTKDLHSISFTGGEPLCQLDFILNLLDDLRKNQISYPLYLETNGTILPDQKQLNSLAKYFRFCCCDIKDRSSKVAPKNKWNDLVQTELEFIKKFVHLRINTFVKIVVTSQTKIDDIIWISKELSGINYPNGEGVGLAIQPVYLSNESLRKKFSITIDHLNQIFYTVANYLSPENISLSIQAHKYLDLL